MLSLNLPFDRRPLAEELQRNHPEHITVVDGRSLDGTTTHVTLFLSTAALAIRSVRQIAEEIIRSKQHKSISLEGRTFQGYSAEEVALVLKKLDEIERK